jgi:hypothetical protein
VAPERRRATLRDRCHDTGMRGWHGPADVDTIRVTVLTEHVRHGERTTHRRDRQRVGATGDATGRGRRSSGLVAEQTVVVAMRR